MILERSIAAPYSVQTNTRSCCSHITGNLRKIQHTVLTLRSGLLFLGQWHNILHQEVFRSLISAMTNVKALSRWDKCIRVLWDYVK